MMSKQGFLLEHNRLAPVNLQVSTVMLSRFRVEKPSLFKGNDWPIEKLRRPLLLWLTSLSEGERESMNS
jgi:hypothetical protein